jgi:hypothetical protein
MELTPESLYCLSKAADDGYYTDEAPTTAGHKVIDKAKAVGAGILGAGASVAGAVQALSTPVPVKQIPRD